MTLRRARARETLRSDARRGDSLTITATLKDGPLQGSSIEAEVIEGRPPKTIDVPTDDRSTCRYCPLAGSRAVDPRCTPSYTASSSRSSASLPTVSRATRKMAGAYIVGGLTTLDERRPRR
jgi:hypothetical protein